MQDRPSMKKDWTGNTGQLVNAASSSDAQPLNFNEIYRFIRRYASLIALITTVCTALSVLYASLAAPVYSAHAQILPLLTPPVDLEKDMPQVLYAQSFNFAVTIASRFKNDVAVWELGNELETRTTRGTADIRNRIPASAKTLLHFTPTLCRVSSCQEMNPE